jgi:protein-S-isoprenylcysteine O-methyltransferase Ste14
LRFLKSIGKGFLQAQRDFWRDMKAVWKSALVTYLMLIIVAIITGKSMDTVMVWFVVFCTGLAAFALIYCLIIFFLNKKNINKKK